jgi:2-dehydropantoate 2-reductase
MKIAVVGCGAVGSYYGGRLACAGEEVHFLLRSDYEAVRRDGLRLRSFQGDFQVRPRCARAPEEIGPSDLVLIGLKTTANEALGRLLPPLAGPATAVLTLQNGLGNEERLARLVPPERILGALCFVCLNRLAPGLIHHIDHGQIVLGEFGRPPEARTHELAALFIKAGVPCSVTESLARTHWEKLTWNIPFNGLGVAGAAGYEAATRGELPAHRPLGPCLTTDQLLGDPKWKELAIELMFEVIRAARALGFDLPDGIAAGQVERTATMGAYKASTLLDFERGLPLELESLFLEPLRQARKAGVQAPRLGALGRLLAAMDARRAAVSPAPKKG